MDGARNVAVPVVCSFESVPKEPSVGQTLAAVGVVLPTGVAGIVV
jgi:hypothetical protein